jgi:hypothetical protein
MKKLAPLFLLLSASAFADCGEDLEKVVSLEKFRGVSVPVVGSAKELRMGSAAAADELKELQTKLIAITGAMPDSLAWPGKSLGSFHGIEIFHYDPSEGSGPWNRLGKKLGASALASEDEQKRLGKVFREDLKIDVEFLTQDEVTDGLKPLPRTAEVQLLRLKTRAAYFIKALEQDEQDALAGRYQQLRNFLEMEGAMPPQIAAAKHEALSQGYAEGHFDNWSGGLQAIPGFSAWKVFKSGAEGAMPPTEKNYEFLTVLGVESRPSETPQMLEAYKAAGAEPFTHNQKTYVTIKGTSAGYKYGQVGWYANEPVFVQVRSGDWLMKDGKPVIVDGKRQWEDFDSPRARAVRTLSTNEGTTPVILFFKEI